MVCPFCVSISGQKIFDTLYQVLNSPLFWCHLDISRKVEGLSSLAKCKQVKVEYVQ